MQKLLSGFGILLSLFVLCASADANIVKTRSNNELGSFDFASGTRTVTFDETDFPPGLLISEIEVAITFKKLSNPAVASPPFYNEISFGLTGSGGGEIQTVIMSAGPTHFTPDEPPGTFYQGFTSDSGFDSTLVFNSKSLTVVNGFPNNRDQIPTTGGPFAADFSSFIDTSTNQIFTLHIGDSAKPTLGDTPLEFQSFTVKITAVPEPGSFACLGLLATAGAFVRRRRV